MGTSIFESASSTLAFSPVAPIHIQPYRQNPASSFVWLDFLAVSKDECKIEKDTSSCSHDMPASSSSSSSLECVAMLSPFQMLEMEEEPSKVETKKKSRKSVSSKSVSFSEKVAVRTHSIIASDHPCCKSGLALELGWEYNDGSGDLCSKKKSIKRLSLEQRLSLLERASEYSSDELDSMLSFQQRKHRMSTPRRVTSSACKHNFLQKHSRSSQNLNSMVGWV